MHLLQYVEFNHTKSSLETITTGVHQGSTHSRAIMFLDNNLAAVSKSFNQIMCADDTTLLSTLNTYAGEQKDE